MEGIMSNGWNEKATLSEDEFCKIVGISRTTAWRQRNAGKLPHCRIGDKVVYLPKHVDEFLAGCERPAKKSKHFPAQRED
jgi:predicted DNA-binding transcriptional regulator AlpA